jgi:hypothetical protein
MSNLFLAQALHGLQMSQAALSILENLIPDLLVQDQPLPIGEACLLEVECQLTLKWKQISMARLDMAISRTINLTMLISFKF